MSLPVSQILETLVKNCGRRVHIHVANKDFLQEMIKIIGPKNDPPQVVQEKVLNMIQVRNNTTYMYVCIACSKTISLIDWKMVHSKFCVNHKLRPAFRKLNVITRKYSEITIIFVVNLQTWADAFQGSPDLKEVGKVYQDLKNKGIEFPMTDLDNMAPIHTPARVSSTLISV